ncbi:hypothetical protein GPZ74_16375 [Burkholderia pseudomallei]|uniref:hypothetical protein n=1 Tax=Burkholderia pseudomallei TaxID=28450 RepID=UPI00132087C4|nr:hypothetical protein [Burkholderia pseudomallei]MVZ85566.1 hypothetical protein [Burkholderia pseudomallei]
MTTTENSRADALTEAQQKALETAVNVLNINWEHETANELWEAFTAPSSQPAAAPADLQGLRRSILTSREIVRDQDGMLSHPAVPYLDEDVNYETFFAAFGIEATFIHMEDDVDCDTYDRYFASNSPDCCTWTPSSPQGDGWMLLEIYDTEDGPVALYVREKKPESMRERWKREKRESDAAAPAPAEERAASWHCEDPVQKCRAQCDSCAKQARAATEIADERAASFEAWCDRFPEISGVERLRDAWQEARVALPEDRIDWIANTHCLGGTAYPVNVKNAIREALREARISDNETGAQVAQQLSAEIAELKIKLVSYEREREDQTRYLAAQSEEIAGLKQQLAHADARVELTATVIQKCIDSCAAEYLEDVTGHPEDAAYCQGITDCIDALNRLKSADWSVILAAHRIEQLRKALFESRDAMRVMSNWAKKPDPAGHSWAVRMVDRANAALNGEPEPRAEVTGGDELKARRLIRYGECRCILTQYCDGMCNPIYEDDARTGASTSALDAYKVAPVTLLEQQKRSIAERHFQGAPDVCRALKCIDEACAEMLTTARTGASS